MNRVSLRRQYELEKELTTRILNSNREERAEVIKECYQIWFTECLPNCKDEEIDPYKKLQYQIAAFSTFIGNNRDICEIGCSTGNLIIALSETNQNCVGIDASDPNWNSDKVTFIRSGDINIPLGDSSFDVVISDQFLEHLHPEDVPIHLREVSRVLKPGGRYIIRTPNPITGPHDISKYFDQIATCLHLKEWTYQELGSLLKEQGFVKLRTSLLHPFINIKLGLYTNSLTIHVFWKSMLEQIFKLIPMKSIRGFMCKLFDVYNVTICAYKR